jgi:hypothetical protein
LNARSQGSVVISRRMPALPAPYIFTHPLQVVLGLPAELPFRLGRVGLADCCIACSPV